MHVEVNDPRDKQVLSRAYGSQGRVSIIILNMTAVDFKINLVYIYLSFAWRASNLLDVQFYKLELVWRKTQSSS